MEVGGTGPGHDVQPHLKVHPRHSLQRKLVLWTLAMVIVPTLLCAVILNRLAHRALTEAHAGSAVALSQSIAHALVGHIAHGWTPEAQHVLDGLFLERRLAFIIVTDRSENVLQRRSIDNQAWTRFTEATGTAGRGGAIEVDTPIFVGDDNEIVVRRTPVWDTTQRAGHARRLDGFVLLGMRERSLPASLGDLRLVQALVAAALCLLCLPLIWLGVRRWTAPLRELMQATVRLGAGQAPPPVEVRTRDEVGLLGELFNDMARNLCSAQRQLTSANEHLERKVQARTAELQEVNLRLQAEISEKNEFLRAVSHDLGAPLRNIEGMAGILLNKYRAELADDALAKLERINANVKIQIELLNDLLELSRIRTRPGRREPVDLNVLVAEVRDNLSYDLEAARITLTIAGDLPTIIAERNRMRQVFQNLLDNAAKYMLDAADRRITVSHRREQGVLCFSVADTGCGIAAEDQPHIFEVFRRAAHSGSHHVAGKGIGLASVKAIVECYGGRIWLESAPGQGAAFHFTLSETQVLPAAACAGASPALS